MSAVVIILYENADPARVRAELTARGIWTSPLTAAGGVAALAVEPYSAAADPAELAAIPGVRQVLEETTGHPLLRNMPRDYSLGEVRIGGGGAPLVMAGPCSAETPELVMEAAQRLAAMGVQVLRGGAYKPRTNPHSFQGHGPRALQWLRDAADRHGLKLITETMGEDSVSPVAEAADIIQIGSRNMYNHDLLRRVGKTGKPVLLKRGVSATIEEWMGSAETLLLAGAPFVLFCERGIRGYDAHTRNFLDLGSVALLRRVHGLPVAVDPSHAAGRRDLIPPLSLAAAAAGACALLIETHPSPGMALSDGPQALPLEELSQVIRQIRRLAPLFPDESAGRDGHGR
ncbi:MAG: 2-dehydro-3-deoxyphosphooctonate aldolase [Myxococcota bacterium]|nr:2-dehydro-3-deoxyphosphooctonate aldolase [Myxococcota bacterium]